MPRPTSFILRFFVPIVLVFAPIAGAQHPAPSNVPTAQTPAPTTPAQASGSVAGVLNFTRVDATFACGGAMSSEAMAAAAKAGFKSIVNLRAATEPGANVEEFAQAAKAAGITYIHIPFVSAAPDPAKLDEFLEAVARPANQPMLLHCAGGVRASMFWAVKRVMIDGWTLDKAMAELPDLFGRVSPQLRAFMLDYLKQHGKV